MKVLLITDIPNPYRIPLFNELDRQINAEGWSWKVIFGSARQANRKFELDLEDCRFPYHILDSKRYDLGYTENTVVNYKGLGKIVNQEKPDALIVIGFTLATMKLWLRSLTRRTPYLIWGGSTQAPASVLRRIQRSLLARRAKGFVAYGSRSARYFASLGVSESRIFTAINTTDTIFFEEKTKALKVKTSRPRTPFQLTYTGYLSPRKNVGKLLDVAHALNAQRQDFVLNIVGDGPERDALENRVKSLGISDRVVFHGFVQPEGLPSFLAKTDVFLFQTDFDIWGLVLVEAMAAGLVCLASTHAGATDDLIIEGETGYRMDFGDTSLATTRIHDILEDSELASRMGRAAAQHVRETASLEKSAAGFVRALKEV